MKDPKTLVLAWLVLPSLAALVAGGIGLLLARAAGMRLRTLTLPAGFAGGIAVGSALLPIGVSAAVTVLALGALAILGYALSVRRPLGRPGASALLAAGSCLVTYLLTVAPVVGSGRSGILGYTLNNDPSVHIAAIELIRTYGFGSHPDLLDSYHQVSGNLTSGYPIGSYVWPLLAAMAGSIDSFHVWSPLVALSAGMVALVTVHVVRRLGASSLVAGLAGIGVGCGYLPYSYAAQGGMKEVQAALTIYATVALFSLAVAEGLTWRTVLPAAAGAAAGVGVFGIAALAWLGPAGLVVLIGAAVLLARRRAPVQRLQIVTALGVGALVWALLALSSLVLGTQFVQAAGTDVLNDSSETGNLLAPLRWIESLNVWFARDYRYPTAENHDLTLIAVWVAGALAVLGLAFAIRRRQLAVPLAVITGVAGVAMVLRGPHGIYLDAKSFCILAPALGLATAAGVVALQNVHRAGRYVGAVLGLALLVGVIASDVYVYRGVWITPKERFDEMVDIDKRFAGRGPMLVNEREDYAKYFLRDVEPWDSWGQWQYDRGLRVGKIPPAIPHLPDFDDYTLEHLKRFPLLLERLRPGGSRPPDNYRPVYETAHYRVWQRTGPMPRVHLAIGNGDVIGGMGKLDCRSRDVRALLDGPASRKLVVARGTNVWQSLDYRWKVGGDFFPGPQANFNNRLFGTGLVPAPVPRGRYEVWVQGSFGPGVRLSQGGHAIGEAFSDLAVQDSYQRLGPVTVKRAFPVFDYFGLHKPGWQAGSHRWNLVGPFVFESLERPPRVWRVSPRELRGLCGTRVDWVEAF